MALRAIFLFLLAIMPMHVAAAPVPQEIVEYRVRPGDNLYTLAQRHFVRSSDFSVVQRLNKVADPYRLPVGKVLRIPKALLRYETITARIVAFRGNVRIIAGRSERLVKVGDLVRETEHLATGPSSFVTLRMPDDSVVSLPSQSRVEVRRLRKWALIQNVDRLFGIVRGRARATVTPMKSKEDEFRFISPVAVSAVRGTEFRVSFDPDSARATTEVLEGAVGMSGNAAAADQLLAGGYGAVATANGIEARQLLASPKLLRPGRVQDEEMLTFEAEAVEGAASYHVQVAQDAGFLDVVSEAFSPEPRASLPGVTDGTWFVRISAVDKYGLEGLQETYSFQRRLNRIEASLETRRAGNFREYLFRWQVEGEGTRQYRFQMSRDREDAPAMVDEPGLTTQRFVVTDLPPGTYFWRVQTLQFVDGDVNAKWSPFQRLTIAPDE